MHYVGDAAICEKNDALVHSSGCDVNLTAISQPAWMSWLSFEQRWFVDMFLRPVSSLLMLGIVRILKFENDTCHAVCSLFQSACLFVVPECPFPTLSSVLPKR